MYPDENRYLDEIRAHSSCSDCIEMVKGLPEVGNKRFVSSIPDTHFTEKNPAGVIARPRKNMPKGIKKEEEDLPSPAEKVEQNTSAPSKNVEGDLSTPLYVITGKWITSPFEIRDMLYDYRMELLQSAKKKSGQVSEEESVTKNEQPNPIDNLLLKIA